MFSKNIKQNYFGLRLNSQPLCNWSSLRVFLSQAWDDPQEALEAAPRELALSSCDLERGCFLKV